MREVSYNELKREFEGLEDAIKKGSSEPHKRAVLVFTEDSFKTKYSRLDRAYMISSNSKAFQWWMSGYSLFGCCIGDQDSPRLSCYMADEGVEGGWKIESCYILEDGEEFKA